MKSDAWATKFNRWRERRMWKKIEKAYGPMTLTKEFNGRIILYWVEPKFKTEDKERQVSHLLAL